MIERAQARRLQATLAHAREHVPYYRETMRRMGLDVGDFRSAADLAKLPLIEHEDVQRDVEHYTSRAQPLKHYVNLSTGGTMGAPLNVLIDPFALFQRGLHWERHRLALMRAIGRRLNYREVLISVSGGMFETSRLAFERRKLAPSGIRVRRWRLPAEDRLEDNIAAIDEIRPDVIVAYASYLEGLFAHLRATGVPFHRPRAVVYFAEGLSDPARRLIEDGFGVPALGVYSAAETPQIGFECERRRGYHLSVDLCPVRIVGPEGETLPPGETGEVVVSNLVSRGTILLNYRLRDLAATLPERCPCGRSLPLLSAVAGRTDEWLETLAGPVHSMTIRPLLHGEGIWRYQMVQQTRARFHLSLVVAPECDREGTAASLRRRLTGALGEGTTVDIAYSESLPRTSAGKTRSVIGMPAAERSDADAPAPVR